MVFVFKHSCYIGKSKTVLRRVMLYISSNVSILDYVKLRVWDVKVIVGHLTNRGPIIL